MSMETVWSREFQKHVFPQKQQINWQKLPEATSSEHSKLITMYSHQERKRAFKSLALFLASLLSDILEDNSPHSRYRFLIGEGERWTLLSKN